MGIIEHDDIVTSLRCAGVWPGDHLFLHSDAIILAQLKGQPARDEAFESLLSALRQALGADGTLIIPTFTYSFTKGEDYDVRHSPSMVGDFTEFVRKRFPKHRSHQPIFSVVALGPDAVLYQEADVADCFGPESAFGRLYQKDGMIVCAGCSLERITFTHFVEQKFGVDYRYMKDFSGKILDDAHPHGRSVTTRYLVRDLERATEIDLSVLKAEAERRGALQVARLGRFPVYGIRARAFEEVAIACLNEKKNALIREGLT